MSNSADRSGLTMVQWLVCIIASIGFAFDIYELLMLPLVIRPALLELAGISPGSDQFANWFGLLFYVPAFAGGIVGLLGGYLTDRLGRRRVLTWSILIYASSACAAGFSTSLEMLLFFRCTTFVGVCVEFVAAVAWLAELFPDRHQRERVLGYTQAFSSFGGLLVAIANGLAVQYAAQLPALTIPDWLLALGADGAQFNSHAPWRYTLISGLIPAFPLIVIRPFLPESPAWQAKRSAGTLKRPSITELFSPALARTTIVTTIMFACSYGAAFGAIQMIPQIVPGLQNVREAVKDKPVPQQKLYEQSVASEYTKIQEIGGLCGRALLAFFAVRIVSRRNLLRMFQLPGLLLVPAVFALFLNVPNITLVVIPLHSIYLGELPITVVSLGCGLAGLTTVAQFSFWGNYLPRVYPVHLRGTGESFAANIGGRLLGTSFAWVNSRIAAAPWVPGATSPEKIAYTAAGIALLVYAVGSIACCFLPEPKHEDLPD